MARRDTIRLWMKWTALGAIGVLGLGPIGASAWNLANTATRTVLIQTEDTPCDNIDDYGADTFSNRFCISAGSQAPRGSLPAGPAACCTSTGSNGFCTGPLAPSACCTGVGTGTCTEAAAGTCDGDNLLPPDFGAPTAGCTVWASPTADFTDATGASYGSADFVGTLTSTGAGTWNIAVSPSVYAGIIGQTLTESGAVLIQNAQCTGVSAPHPCCTGAGTGSCDVSPLIMDVNTVTGVVSAPTPATPPSPGGFQYWRANGLFPGVPITLIGEANATDFPYFGSTWFNTDPAGPFGGGYFPSQCLAAGSPGACCDGFLTDAPANCPVPTLTGVPLTLSCAGAAVLPGNSALFGPGFALAGAGGHTLPINAALCDPPGTPYGDPATTNFIAQPGQSQVGNDTYITAFTISRVFGQSIGANATTPAFATQDVRVVEDTDGDGIPDSVDNCIDVPNADQADIGGLGAGSPPDGIGNACQCGDVNNDGRVAPNDATILKRALLSPPTQCGATTGAGDCAGGFKCDTNNNGACAPNDATIITRALLTPPTASINPGCGPAPIVP